MLLLMILAFLIGLIVSVLAAMLLTKLPGRAEEGEPSDQVCAIPVGNIGGRPGSWFHPAHT